MMQEPASPEARDTYIGRQLTIASGQQGRDESRRYHLIARLGEGGFGTVYQAEDTFFNNRSVAIKSIHLIGLSTSQIIEATDGFNREVMLLSGLEHPHLPRIYDHFTDPEHWYLVMEYLNGETLEDYLQTYQENFVSFADSGMEYGCLLPLVEICDIAWQLCEVLDYLHTRQSPIIFRDLKPSNIMRTRNGHLYLIDFGIARIFKPGQPKDTIPFGSPGYAAPEQYGKAQTTPRADIYSLGALLHYLLTGHDPAENNFAFALLPPLPPELHGFDALIKQMLEMNRDNRPADIREVKDRLEFYMRNLGLLPSIQNPERPVESPQQPVRPSYTRRRIAIISLATLIGATCIGGIEIINSLQMHSSMRDITLSDPTKVKKIQSTPTPNPPTSTPDPSTPVSAIPVKPIVYTGHTNAVQAVTWSPDGKRIASAGIDAQVHVWDARSGQRYFTCIGHTDIIQAVAWSPDGQYIASGSRDHTIRIWNAKTGQVASIYTGHPLGVNTLCWSPLGTGPLLVSGSDDPVVHVWSAPDARLIQTHSNAGKGNPSRINTVSWGNLEFIISGGEDTYIEPWGAPNSQGTGMGIYGIYSGPVLALAWAPGYVGRRLPLVGITEEDSLLCCWPFGTTTATWTVSLPGISHPGSPQKGDIAWSPDSQWIAASLSSSPTVSIFDAPTGTSHFIYHGHTAGVNAVSCSPATAAAGTLCIASGSMDKTVHVWQWKPGSSEG